MDVKYIYGIMKNGNQTTLGISGLGKVSQVHTVSYQELSCVLSDYSGNDFGSMSKEEVVQCLLTHQVVVEHVMKEHTVLPVKFGTVLATCDEVRNLLSQSHQQFVDTLGWIQDKVEVEVAATWDTGRVLREISTEPEVVRIREAIASKPEPTLKERIHLGQMAKASMDRRRHSYRKQLIKFLMPLAVDVQPNALVSDEMIMNVAFLVERANKEGFDKRVKQLNDLFDDQLNFRLIGPLPPYSFATVEVTKPNLEKIKEARQLLYLGEDNSEPEVRRAYRRLAAKTHPDCKPGDELAKIHFAELRRASDLLVTYCRSQAQSGGSLLVNIRRRRDEEVQHLSFAENWGVAGATDG